MLTGVAGFIGSGLCGRLLQNGHRVVGIDNLNDYYDVGLKKARLSLFSSNPAFHFVEGDISDRGGGMEDFFREHVNRSGPVKVAHMAAQAGVRYSLQKPHVYMDSNLIGFLNILEGCRHSSVDHLVYASSISVYGLNSSLPYSVHEGADRPLSLYAATKKANELMAHSYSHLFGLPTTGLRFFTVYGPWGRPDIAIFDFTRSFSQRRAHRRLQWWPPREGFHVHR